MKRVGIVGYRGYSGAELVHLLDHHAHVEPVLMDHREDPGGTVAIRRAQPPPRIACTGDAVRQEGLAVVFLATPPEVSMELAPIMLASGARVVDLSGAFRLGTPAHYAAWYKETHTQPELLAEAVYGLPEFCRDRIPAARLVSTRRGASGAPPPATGRRNRSRQWHRLRRQIGRQRRRTQAQPQDQLLRGHRELFGVLHPLPSSDRKSTR